MSLLRPIVKRAGALPLFALVVSASLPVGFATAKAPDAADMPTIETLLQRALTAKAAAAEAAVEAARDPRKEAIEAYRDKKSALDDFTALTAIINNSKDDDLQIYRNQAAQAAILRFKTENLDDPQVRKTRAAFGEQIVDLMKGSSSDQVGLAIIQEVLQTWWSTKTREVRFKATDKWRDRNKSWRKMKTYLQGGSR